MDTQQSIFLKIKWEIQYPNTDASSDPKRAICLDLVMHKIFSRKKNVSDDPIITKDAAHQGENASKENTE